MTKIYNKIKSREIRRKLRNNMPKAEVILWQYLKNKQLAGFKFRRQYGVGRYVLDFYCPKARLAIEVDGPSHFTKKAKIDDQERQQSIESLGIKFIRVNNLDIYKNMEGVYQKIIRHLSD